MKTFSSTEILNRLKEALSTTSDTELADLLGIKKSTLSNWRNRNSIDLPLVFSFCEHINIDWLITGRGEMIKPTENLISRHTLKVVSSQDDIQNIAKTVTPFLTDIADSIVTKNTPGAIPLVSEKAAGGLINDENMNINERDVIGYYVIPKFRHLNVDFLIEVYGDSMVPFIYPGDIIACSIIHESRFMHWNKPHLIATHEQGMIVKRLRKSTETGCLLAVSDNAEYDPFDIPKDEIAGLARVVGVIHIE